MPRLRRHQGLLLELLLLALATAAVGFVTLSGPGDSAPKATFAPTILGDQPPNAVVLGREDGDRAVGLAVAPAPAGLLLVATVIGPDGTGVADLTSSFTVVMGDARTTTATGVAGTAGYYEATIATIRRPTKVTLTLEGGKPLTFAMPAAWPPRPGLALIRRTEAAYRKLRSLTIQERLGTDATHVQRTTFDELAPDRQHIITQGKLESIVIGKARWDRQPGGPWRRTGLSSAIPSVAPYWAGRLENATLLGSARVGGRTAWIVSFVGSSYPGFFTAWIDKRSNRTLRLDMTASAHFMVQTYGGFDAPLEIRPPR